MKRTNLLSCLHESPAGARSLARAARRASTGLRAAVAVLALAGMPAAPTLVAAQSTGHGASALAIFDGADLKLGRQLIDEHACEECHARNAGGDGTGIYRPTGRITTPGALRGMVEYCNTQLNLGMFPEEVTAVAAVLQRDYYRFR